MKDYEFTDFTMPSQSQPINSQDHYKASQYDHVLLEEDENEGDLTKRMDDLKFQVQKIDL